MRPASAMARNRIPRHMEAIMTAPASAIEGVLFCQLLLAEAYATLSDDFSSSPCGVCTCVYEKHCTCVYGHHTETRYPKKIISWITQKRSRKSNMRALESNMSQNSSILLTQRFYLPQSGFQHLRILIFHGVQHLLYCGLISSSTTTFQYNNMNALLSYFLSFAFALLQATYL
jgi:hypothetical protein